MKQNVGPVDRVIRLVLGIILGYAAFAASGVWVWVAGAAAVIVLVTAAAGFCPLYAVLGINTNPARTPGALRQ